MRDIAATEPACVHVCIHSPCMHVPAPPTLLARLLAMPPAHYALRPNPPTSQPLYPSTCTPLHLPRQPVALLQVVRGRVKRVEKFGVFVELGAPHAGVTGLAHVSQLADDFVKDVASLFTLGQSESPATLLLADCLASCCG